MSWFALLCMLLVVSVAKAADNEPHRKLRVLFVGNSYLYHNDLPRQVQVLAAERGMVVETVLLAEPDYSLSDHLRQRRLDPLLEQPWDWVVLQPVSYTHLDVYKRQSPGIAPLVIAVRWNWSLTCRMASLIHGAAIVRFAGAKARWLPRCR